MGRTFLYDESWGICAYAGYLIRARVDLAQVMPEFISYFSASQSYTSWLRTVAIQATIENVNAERYSMMPVPLPPLSEQAAIVRYLDHETADLDVAIDRASQEIELLNEYRTRLIADVVTGKLDVREVAADLPEADPADLEDIIEIDETAADELDAKLEDIAT